MFVVGGESLIDLVPVAAGPDGAPRLEAHAGGSPMNCAIALSLLGHEAGFMCPISQDGFGDIIAQPLQAAGVKPLLTERVEAPSSLAVVTLNQRGQAQYEFYREADRAFTRDSLLAALPDNPKLFQIGGFCAIRQDDAEVWLEVAREAARRGAVISMDPNVRPSLVDDFEAYRNRLEQFFALVHLVKLSDEDLAALDGSKSVEVHAQDLLARPNCKFVAVTMGENGSRAFTVKAEGRADIHKPDVFGDTVGAGDSLMAGLLSRLNDRGDLAVDRLGQIDAAGLDEVLRFGAITAGLNCAHKGCHPPKRVEVEAIFSA